MKKILFILVSCVLFTLSAHAQKVRYGVKAGFSYANVKVKNSNADDLLGLNAGVFAQYDLSSRFSIQPELLFTQGGAKGDYKLRLNYLTLPVMGKFRIINNLTIEVGPQVGYLISARSDGENLTKGFEEFSFALNFGLGYKIMKHILVDIRYVQDFKNINAVTDVNMKNQMLQLAVGYIF